MKTFTLFLMAAAALAMTSGCGGGGGSKAVDAYLTGMNKVADAVEKVNDEASAKKAAEVISSVGEDMRKISAEVNGMSDAEKRAMYQAHEEEFNAAQQRVQQAMFKLVGRPDLLKIISDEMSKLPDMQ